MSAEEIHRVREAFAKTLRIKRQALGISQEELAERSGLTMRYISLLECNKRQPTLTTLYVLSQALGISLVEMVS